MKVWKKFLALGLTAGLLLSSVSISAAAEEASMAAGSESEVGADADFSAEESEDTVDEKTVKEAVEEEGVPAFPEELSTEEITENSEEEDLGLEEEDSSDLEEEYALLGELIESNATEEELLGALTPNMINGEWKGIMQAGTWNISGSGEVTNYKVVNDNVTLNITGCNKSGSFNGIMTKKDWTGTYKIRISGNYNFSTGALSLEEKSVISKPSGWTYHCSGYTFEMEPDRMMMRADWHSDNDPIASRIKTNHLYKTDFTTGKNQKMKRLYSPSSGEHFYTSNDIEVYNLRKIGWKYEGIGWIAPNRGDMVYRMYNSVAGEHHYTRNFGELDSLSNAGWSFEGIGWFSDPSQRKPLYREYNPNAYANNHNYTTSKKEHNWLISLGWKNEGIAWYGLK
ncbi:MAG: hypothetical protein Q4B22_07600 [Eubacteriales bacterium]|nr:hypothetical protein [Eubacteriales bacterium]